MIFITNEQVKEVLTYEKLVDALFDAFCSEYEMPLRHHHFYTVPGIEENTLILMPSWTDKYLGVKQVVLAPGNSLNNMPATSALYTLSDVKTGKAFAVMNAEELTSRRTACTSALAAKYLARKDASTLLVLGGGKVAKHLVPAHAAVRNYKKIIVWMRNKDKFEEFRNELSVSRDLVVFADNLEEAVREADVISCATMTVEPLVKGEWVKPGAHLDLVGSYKPDMREVDDEAILKSRIFVDSRMGALHETGELAIPIKTGIIKESDVVADITELCLGKNKGRENENEVTIFKSAGLAIEDLAAALLTYQIISE